MTTARRYLFVDTNVFLHFRCFVEIDWNALAGRDATVVVPHRPTINELDRHKNENDRARLRERAETAIQKIKALVAGTEKLRDGAAFEIWMVNPLARDGLDLSYADDRLLAAALEFAEQRKVDVAIVTADGGLQLRAPQFRLAAVELPNDLKLPHAPDPAEAKLRQLQAEIAAKPVAKLRLAFGNGSAQFLRQIIRGAAKSDKAILAAAQEQYEEDHEDGGLRPPDRDWVRREVAHQKNLREYETQRRISFPLALVLINEGTAPAKDIHVTVAVPEPFRVSSRDLASPAVHDYLSEAFQGLGSELEAPFNWQIDRQKAVYRADSLKHKRDEALPPLFCTLRDPEYRVELILNARINVGDPPIDQAVALSIKIVGD